MAGKELTLDEMKAVELGILKKIRQHMQGKRS